MNAKRDDAARIQEVYDVVSQTLAQVEDVGFTRERFVLPKCPEDDLMAEGLMNRVFRATEEGSKLSDEFAEYGFPLKEMSGLRNILAHAYGQVDRAIVWAVIEKDFPNLLSACEDYCRDKGWKLSATSKRL